MKGFEGTYNKDRLQLVGLILEKCGFLDYLKQSMLIRARLFDGMQRSEAVNEGDWSYGTELRKLVESHINLGNTWPKDEERKQQSAIVTDDLVTPDHCVDEEIKKHTPNDQHPLPPGRSTKNKEIPNLAQKRGFFNSLKRIRRKLGQGK